MHRNYGKVGNLRFPTLFLKKYHRFLGHVKTTDVEGIIGALAWNACDQDGRRRLVSIRTKDGTLVANLRQCSMIWET